MPLFFVLSGVLYKRRGFVETVRKTFKTLLIPYFLISFICLGYYLALLGLQGGITWIDIWNRVGAIFLGLGYDEILFGATVLLVDDADQGIEPVDALVVDRICDANSALNVPSGAFSNVPSVTDSNVPLQMWLL